MRTWTNRSAFPAYVAVSLLALDLACAQSQSDPPPVGDGQATGGDRATGGSGAASGGSAGAGTTAGAAGTGGAAGSSATGGHPGAGGAASGGQAGGRFPNGGGGGAMAETGGTGGNATAGCAGNPYKLCEDFETGTVGSIPTGWTKLQGYGTSSPKDAALATDAFRSGAMSLKSIAGTKGTARVQKSLAGIGATASKHWGRIFYKVQSPAVKPASGVLHMTFVSLIGPKGENRVVDVVEASNGTHQWLFNDPDDSCCTSSAYNWTFDADWHCAEWYVDVSTNSYRFFSDSKEVTALAFTNKTNSEMSPYTSIAVGATYYQSDTFSPPFVMWFDDLAISDTQIGCQ